MSWLLTMQYHTRRRAWSLLLCTGIGLLAPDISVAQWERTGGGLGDYPGSMVVSGTDILVGTWDAGVFRSRDNGASWEAVNSGLPENTSVWCLVVSGAIIFAGTEDHGVFRSVDSGATWAPASSGLPSDVTVSGLTVTGGDLYAGTWGDGVFVSNDEGKSWEAVGPASAPRYVRRLAASGGDLIVLSGPELGAVFLFRADGEGWRHIDAGVTRLLAERHPGTVMPADPFIAALAVTDTNLLVVPEAGAAVVEIEQTYPLDGVFSSADGGVTWTELSQGIGTNIRVYCMIVSDATVFAGTVRHGVFASIDGGVSWARVNSGLADGQVLELVVAQEYLFAGISHRGVWRLPLSKLALSKRAY